MGSILWGPTPSSLPSPAQVQTRLFFQVPSDVAFHFPTPRVLLPSSVTALFSSFPGSLCPVKLDRPVSRPPKQSLLRPAPLALSRGLTSGAKDSVPSPHPGILIFGDCAYSSDGPFGSPSAFQNSNLLLHSSLHLDIPPVRLIFPPSRCITRVRDPFLLLSSLSGAPVPLRFTFSHSPLFSHSAQ